MQDDVRKKEKCLGATETQFQTEWRHQLEVAFLIRGRPEQVRHPVELIQAIRIQILPDAEGSEVAGDVELEIGGSFFFEDLQLLFFRQVAKWAEIRGNWKVEKIWKL